MARAYPRVRTPRTLRSSRGSASKRLARATAAVMQVRRVGCCCSSTSADTTRGRGSSRCRTSRRGQGPTLSVASALEQACAHHASAAALTSSPSARPRSCRLKLFPPEYVRILYCTPTGWTPGAKGFAGAACAAASDYHVLVPSEGDRGRWPQHGGDALSEPAVWSGLPALRWGVRGPCRLGRAIQVLVLLVPPCATNRHRWRAPRHVKNLQITKIQMRKNG